MDYTNNGAFQDIINSDRYKGAIDSISWLTGALDVWFVQIISICGFFIISIAMLRNVMCGLFVMWPRGFLRIHEIKVGLKEKYSPFGGGGLQGGNVAKKGGGLVLWVISLVIPDVVDILDMQPEEIDSMARDPKKFFTTAVMQLVVGLIIGTVVYNGLYRDVAAKGADLGVHVIENYIVKVNFVEGFDSMLNSGKDYVFTFGDDTQGKRQETLAKKIYNEMKNVIPGVQSTESKSKLGIGVQTYVNNLTENIETKFSLDSLWDSADFDYAVSISYLGTVDQRAGTPESSDNQGKLTYIDFPSVATFGYSASDIVSADSNAADIPGHTCMVRVVFNRKSSTATQNFSTMEATIYLEQTSLQINSGSKEWLLTAGASSKFTAMEAGEWKLVTGGKTHTVKLKVDSSKLTVIFSENAPSFAGATLTKSNNNTSSGKWNGIDIEAIVITSAQTDSAYVQTTGNTYYDEYKGKGLKLNEDNVSAFLPLKGSTKEATPSPGP